MMTATRASLRFVFLLSALLPGCALVGSVASAGWSSALPQLARVAGPGYSAGVPEAELVLIRDRPSHGSITLQSDGDRLTGGEAYHVIPFVPSRPAASLPEAMRSHPQANFDRAVLHGQRHTTFRGYPAYFFSAYFPATAQTPPSVTANCLVRVGPRYYLIARDIRLPLLEPTRTEEIRRRNQQRADAQLRTFLGLFRFEPGT